MAARKTNEL